MVCVPTRFVWHGTDFAFLPASDLQVITNRLNNEKDKYIFSDLIGAYDEHHIASNKSTGWSVGKLPVFL